ncbi:Peroxidase 40 [Acorus gramineus]|uniref:Peroxidase n=1 Tax=Acorus gramineus TaxID=55184 RepID=A0AAV9B035_ACOGR|nr:Peroxidase 40 [Acorus gramineus]
MFKYFFIAQSLLLLNSASSTHACLGGGGSSSYIGGGGGSEGGGVENSLGVNTYQTSCPDAEDIIFSWVETAVLNEPRMAASLLRLHFHDCFVNGCDASVLLDDAPGLVGEKTAGPNANSLRGFDVIDSIKADLEAACPGVVSCADVLAVAARDGVVVLGGPTWDVETGRKDGRTVSKSAANNNIPGPNSDVPTLISKFQNTGLSARDMVALSGGHTIGNARCATFASRLSNSGGSGGNTDGSVDRDFLQSLQDLCAADARGNNSATLASLDYATPTMFDNQYYVNLLSGQGLLGSDQALVGGTDGVGELVEAYAADVGAFFEDFKASMLKMGRLGAVGGGGGEVRRNCRSIN